MLRDCGCNGEISGHHPDGEPYIERTIDIGFCALHAAAPDLLAALDRLMPLAWGWQEALAGDPDHDDDADIRVLEQGDAAIARAGETR